MRTTFEDRLLTELQGEVTRTAGLRRERRRIGVGVAGAALVGVLLAGIAPSGPPPVDGAAVARAAYRVQTDGADEVTVTIYRRDDAEGLERRLREAGVEADVEYDSYCDDPYRYSAVPYIDISEIAFDPAGDPLLEFTVRRSDIGDGTLVLHLLSSIDDAEQGFAMYIGVADGPVPPCTEVGALPTP